MIKIGIICPSEIAARRFLPAIQSATNIHFVGVAVASRDEFAGATKDILDAEYAKAESMVSQYGGRVFDGYRNMIESDDIDAIYLPLPPGLHYTWAKLALQKGKHVLVEKPFTTTVEQTKELIEIAREKKLAVHENYMFVFHKQIEEISKVIKNGIIGDVRLYRINFGFPLRSQKDFRYNPKLGGGAILDCGGYTLKYASFLLGDNARIVYAKVNNKEGFDVDMYGSAALVDDEGVTAQVAFGMDNDYRCELDVWGSLGTLYSGRVLTAPAGFVPEMQIKKNGIIDTIPMESDDAFLKSVEHFASCLDNDIVREENYQIISRQASLLESFLTMNSLS